MKRTIGIAILSFLILSGVALANEEGKVVYQALKEISYASDVSKAEDGIIKIEAKVEWEGVRIVKLSNTCHEEAQKIKRFDVKVKYGAKYQVPVVERTTKEVACPSVS